MGLLLYHCYTLYKESYTSEYTYEIRIGTDSVLHNVTVYVPFPVSEKGIDEAIATALKPEGWHCSIVQTEYGEMLEITAEKIVPVAIPDSIVVNIRSDHRINTKNPMKDEPVLSPKYMVTHVTCWFPHDEKDPYLHCYTYESYVYADYTVHAAVTVSIRMEGQNSWWVYGWTFNRYYDSIMITFKGEQHGWVQVSGKLVEGEGVYCWV